MIIVKENEKLELINDVMDTLPDSVKEAIESISRHKAHYISLGHKPSNLKELDERLIFLLKPYVAFHQIKYQITKRVYIRGAQKRKATE